MKQFEVSQDDQGKLTVVMNGEMASVLLDTFEDALDAGVRFPKRVYALGEALNRLVSPDEYFGVRKAA